MSDIFYEIARSLPGILFCRYTTLYALFVGNLVIYEVFGTDSCWNVPQIIPTLMKLIVKFTAGDMVNVVFGDSLNHSYLTSLFFIKLKGQLADSHR